jgi:hypothetical protein
MTRLSRLELPLVLLVAALVLCSIPVLLGHIGISWDMLNHHIYLGWVADSPRFDRDFLAASYQSYQYPYLYWPVYKLALGGASGVTAGVVLALIHLTCVPPVWMLARTCIPGTHVFDVAMRALAVALAFTSTVVLSMFDSTANDLMAATPLVWALAFAFLPLDRRGDAASGAARAIMISGFFAGVAAGFKLSNLPLAVLLPLVWLAHPAGWREHLRRLLRATLAGAGGYLLVYGYWGWQLWLKFGNPVYPFAESWFAQLRGLLGISL